MLRIVVVDDEPDLRMITRLWLEMDEHVVVTAEAADGYEAFRLIERDPPDVAVIDVNMPGLTGPELIRLLRHSTSGIRLVAYSADEGGLTEALLAGADAGVIKNGESSALLDAVGCSWAA
jgi:CheY-like chemotaxis protein